MSEFTLSLKINTVGDREALRALDDLDKKGRKIVEDASSALGKSMGSVAVAYQRGGREMQSALAAVAAGHREAITQAERQGVAADALAARQGRATLQASRGMEQLVRSASGTGSALDTIFAQVSQLAFGFGPAGPLIGAVAVAGLAIVEIFENTKREMKKAVDEAENEFKRLAKAGDRVAIRSRIKELVGGDRFGASDEDVAGIEGARARRKALDAQRAALLAKHPELSASTSVIGGGIARMIGSEAASTIARASDEIRDLDTFLQKVTPEVVQLRGALRQLDKDNADKDAAKGFEDWFKQQERLIKGLSLAGELTAGRVGQLTDEAKAWRSLASTMDVMNPRYERYLVLAKSAADLAEKQSKLPDTATRAAAAFIATLPPPDPGAAGREARAGILAGIMPTKEETDALLFTLKLQIENSLKDTKAVAEAASAMGHQIGSILGEGISAGLEAAFSGKGIGNALKSLTATVLSGLGSFMEQLGVGIITLGGWVAQFIAHILTFDAVGIIASGAGLIAAGAALKAIAGRIGGGAASSSSAGGAGGLSAAPSFLSFGVQASATPTTSQSAPTAKATNNFTIIGPADPKAQRAIADIVNAASDRNLLTARA